jgi:N-acetyl-alpha-D-glucosaminyl L-malate synthase BshA
LKIGIVCYPTYGGSGVVASELGIAMAERGHEVHVFSYQMPFRLQFKSTKITFHKVAISDYPLFKYPPYTESLANELAEKIVEFDLDIIHNHYAIPHGTSAFLAKNMLKDHKVKIITTLHGTDITLVGKEKSFFRITKFIIESTDGLTSVSDWLKNETYANFNIKKQIEVIPNFIDQEEYKDVVLKNFPDCKKIPVLCHISNLRPVKRPLDVVKAFHLVLQKIDCRLMIVGEGPGLDEVVALAKELKILEKITFKGNHADILEVLPCADIMLLPSDKESFGLVALEAMGCGIPVVGYRAGGLPEVVKHGVTGYLAEFGDVQGMANYIISLLSNANDLKNFRQKSKEIAFRDFEKNKVVGQYEDFYKSVIKSSVWA